MLKNFIRDERGEDLIEYGLLAAFVAAIALAVIIADPLVLSAAVQGAYASAVVPRRPRHRERKLLDDRRRGPSVRRGDLLGPA